MNRFNVGLILTVAFIVNAYGNYVSNDAGSNSYAAPAASNDYAPASSYAAPQANSYAAPAYPKPKVDSISTSVTYPEKKGEILIHRPASIYVQQAPTRLVVNHAPLVVKPPIFVLHKPPAVVVRKVQVKQLPRPVNVEPVYVNVVKQPAAKYYSNPEQYVPKELVTCPDSGSADAYSSASSADSSVAQVGGSGNYELVPDSSYAAPAPAPAPAY